MSKDLVNKIKQTQNSFAPQKPGATVACPFAKTVSETPITPVEVKTDFALTQQILKTMGASSKVAEKQKEKKAWIEIILVDMVGKPIPNVRYRITPPSGSPKEGRLNEHGQAGYYQIEPGNCKITFPDLDKDAWD
ncbi:hypothetical protein BH10ACI1_BH10ACI1_29890 [soil metagenome]